MAYGPVVRLGELRKHLGIRADTNDSPTTSAGSQIPTSSSTSTDTPAISPTTPFRPQVILVGHDLRNDLKALKSDGIDFKKHLHYLGYADTQVVFKDSGLHLQISLTHLIARYELAKLHVVKTERKGRRMVFVGAHNAGNDAIATLKVLIAQALDYRLGDNRSNCTLLKDEDWYNKPLSGMNTDMILMAYDSEGIENSQHTPGVSNRTSEHGWAWLRLPDVVDIAPGERGEKWHPYFKAEQWINRELECFENRHYLVGNSKGFWKEFGTSKYYNGRKGPFLPTPLDDLFAKLAGEKGIETFTARLRALQIGMEEPAIRVPSVVPGQGAEKMGVSGIGGPE